MLCPESWGSVTNTFTLFTNWISINERKMEILSVSKTQTQLEVTLGEPKHLWGFQTTLVNF
jgi:hypothetical protein